MRDMTFSEEQSKTTGLLANERSIQQITSWLLVPAPALAAMFLNSSTSWWVFAGLSLVLGRNS
jgi:methyl-accepting chemotaxis protein